jgi:hypothetical protein
MKRTFLFSAMVLILGTALFAEGARETPGRFDDSQEVTLTGTIDISRFPAVLTSDGEQYLVMVPPFAVEGIEIENGQQLTLTGFAHEAYGRFRSGEKVIAVTSAVIDGEEYEVERPGFGGRFAEGPMGFGGRGCFGGAYGAPPVPGGPRPFQRAPMQGGYMQGRPGPQWGPEQPRGWR